MFLNWCRIAPPAGFVKRPGRRTHDPRSATRHRRRRPASASSWPAGSGTSGTFPLSVYAVMNTRALAGAGLTQSAVPCSIGAQSVLDRRRRPDTRAAARRRRLGRHLVQHREDVHAALPPRDSRSRRPRQQRAGRRPAVGRPGARRPGGGDADGPQDPAIIVGNSLGAWVAMLYAREHPDRVARLVLVNGGALVGDRPDLSLMPKTREEAAALMTQLRDPGAEPVPGFVLDNVVREAQTGPIARLRQTAGEMGQYVLDGKLSRNQGARGSHLGRVRQALLDRLRAAHDGAAAGGAPDDDSRVRPRAAAGMPDAVRSGALGRADHAAAAAGPEERAGGRARAGRRAGEPAVIHADVIGERARLTPGKTALVWVPDGSRFTYGDLDERAGADGRSVARPVPVRAGRPRGLLAHNRVEFIDAFFAAARSGVILVPLGTKLTPHEIEFIAKDAGLRGFIYAGEFAEIVRTLAGGTDVERWIALDEPALPGHTRLADLVVHAAAAARSRRRAAPGARGHLLPALHERHHRQAEGRDGAASHGGVERLQHGHVLAAARRRREPDLHAALPRRRPRRVPAADLLHRRHDRAPCGVRPRGDLADAGTRAVHGRARRARPSTSS